LKKKKEVEAIAGGKMQERRFKGKTRGETSFHKMEKTWSRRGDQKKKRTQSKKGVFPAAAAKKRTSVINQGF